MPDSVFRFKEFSIRQQYAAMKVNTDSVLLGAWAVSQMIGDKKKVLDVGTGTGLLAVMVASNFDDISIDAVEIDLEACKDAEFNFSPYKKKIHLHHSGFAEFSSDWRGKYDYIISNPPYFEPININKTKNKQLPDTHRSVARFHDSLPFEILAESQGIMTSNAFFFLIIPIQFLEELERKFKDRGLHKHYYTFVKTLENKEISRVLCKFGKEADQFKQDLLILYHQNNIKTNEYQGLVSKYYL